MIQTLYFLAPMRVEKLVRDSNLVTERYFQMDRFVTASLAIAADGRGSKTRENAGIKTTDWRYPQEAIVCTVEHEKPHAFIAHEHFLPAGPFAILPLKGTPERPAQRSSIVWTERAAHARQFVGLDDPSFIQELSRRFGGLHGKGLCCRTPGSAIL